MQPVGSAVWRSVVWFVLALVVLAAVIVGGWRLNWWFKSQNVNRYAHIYQKSYGAQSAYIQQLAEEIPELQGIAVQIASPSTPKSEKSALEAQRTALNAQACMNAGLVTSQLPPQEAQYVSANC